MGLRATGRELFVLRCQIWVEGTSSCDKVGDLAQQAITFRQQNDATEQEGEAGEKRVPGLPRA